MNSLSLDLPLPMGEGVCLGIEKANTKRGAHMVGLTMCVFPQSIAWLLYPLHSYLAFPA